MFQRRALVGIALQIHQLLAGTDRFVEPVQAALEDREDEAGFRFVAAAASMQVSQAPPK